MSELAKLQQPEAPVAPPLASARTATKRVVIYLRVSTAEQAHGVCCIE